MKEFIEIPFGAKDSELVGWEYNIPEGYTASIENGKIIVKKEESEDERIRKELLDFFDADSFDCGLETEWRNGIKYKDILAWLEKQVEQKSVEKVEPKFKVGDWVVFNNKHQSIYKVEKIENGYYILRHTHGGTFRVCVLHDESLRLWTINDAKDGDVLADENDIVVFKENDYNPKDKSGCMFVYCSCNSFYEIGGINPTFYTPATKEQRDILFQKMKEAGYEWDADKKELKKIEQKPTDEEMKILLQTEYEKGKADAIEQKSTWSEEDGENLNQLHKLIVEKAYSEYDVDTDDETLYGKWLKLDNWLKSFKERYTWKPSDEQIQALEYQVHSTYEGSWQYAASKELLEQLKKL